LCPHFAFTNSPWISRLKLQIKSISVVSVIVVVCWKALALFEGILEVYGLKTQEPALGHQI